MAAEGVTRTDWSQDGEQREILHVVDARTGRFLDVGAFDAYEMSNTRALFEDGWGGTLLEPNPTHAERLRAQYAGEERVEIREVAVVPVALAHRPAVLAVTDDATSTVDRATEAKWADEVAYSGHLEVASCTLDDLWDGEGWDFVNLDAEGYSVPLLADLLRLTAHHGRPPRCICVEYDSELRAVRDLALRYGYGLIFTNGTNAVLRHLG